MNWRLTTPAVGSGQFLDWGGAMKMVVKLLLRGLAILFGMGCVLLLWGAFTEAGSAMLPGVLMLGVLAVGLWYWSGRGDRANAVRKARQEAAAQETLQFMDKVNRAGAFPAVAAGRIVSRPGCPVLVSCEARLTEVSQQQVRQYLGARINVAGIPVFLGQSTPRQQTVMREMAQGELALTPSALIFSGDLRSVDVELDKIIAIDIASDGFVVSIKGRETPFTFMVSNGFLMGVLVKNLVRMEMTSRQLPADSQLVVC